MTGYPDNNPKTAIGVTKVPLHLVPPSAKHYLALALADGARKYGPYNWRDHAISVSVYKAAAERHLDAFWDGENVAPDSGVHHVAHAMACCALMLDAFSLGMLNDDRPAVGAAAALQAEFTGNPPPTTEETSVLFDIDPALLAQIEQQLAADDPDPESAMGLNVANATPPDSDGHPLSHTAGEATFNAPLNPVSQRDEE